MRTTGIKNGDVVLCNVRGETFYALMKAMVFTDDVRLRKGEMRVTPIGGNHGRERIVTARQIVGHWRKAASSRTRGDNE